jgi:hypothetical protein
MRANLVPRLFPLVEFRLRLHVGLVMVIGLYTSLVSGYLIPNDALSMHLLSNSVRRMRFRRVYSWV